MSQSQRSTNYFSTLLHGIITVIPQNSQCVEPTGAEGQLYYAIFYVRDSSIPGIWYLQGVLELVSKDTKGWPHVEFNCKNLMLFLINSALEWILVPYIP